MAQVILKNLATGEETAHEVVDAREILNMRGKDGPAYEVVQPESHPQNMEQGTFEEFKRNPVGANVAKPHTDEDDIVRIRNPVSDQPRMAMAPGTRPTTDSRGAAFDRDTEREMLESQTVDELKQTAKNEDIDLGEAHLKKDIVNALLRARAKAAKEKVGEA